jgi:3',5'-cyclic-AMP phosphodiesterase
VLWQRHALKRNSAPSIMPFAKIITLTDIHIMPDGGTLIGIDPSGRLEVAIAHINRTQSDASLCIITGDLTHKGDVQSYVTLKRILSGLNIPVKILLGNHDKRENFLTVFPETETDTSGFVQFSTMLGGYNLIGLDSLNEPRIEGTRIGAGNLDNGRLEFLSAALAQSNGAPALIFLHHPPFDTAFPGMDAIKLMQSHEFYQCLKPHDVRQIVCGHIHRSISVSWNGIPATVYKSLVDQMPFDLVTVDSSLAVPEPPAYGVILLNGDTVLCHTVDFLSELAENEMPGNVGHV